MFSSPLGNLTPNLLINNMEDKQTDLYIILILGFDQSNVDITSQLIADCRNHLDLSFPINMKIYCTKDCMI